MNCHAHAQAPAAYPVKPIRLVAPFPPGGSVDNVARLIVPGMSESLGQNVVIDNRGGASGNIGMDYVARAPADGYTLLINTVPTIAESGVPNYEFNAWVGVLAPAATPPAIIKLLNEHVVKAARSPVVAERVVRDGADVAASSPEAFRARIAADTAMWARVIKEMGIRAE